MLKIELYNHDNNGDPAVSFATDAEIEIADQLRHQLEQEIPRTIRAIPTIAGAFERRPLIRSTEYCVPSGVDAGYRDLSEA